MNDVLKSMTASERKMFEVLSRQLKSLIEAVDEKSTSVQESKERSVYVKDARNAIRPTRVKRT